MAIGKVAILPTTRPMRRPLVLLALLPALAQAQAPPPRIAPAAGCLDARTVSDMWQPDPTTVAIATTGGRLFRLTLAQACPGLEADPDAQLLAPDGWVCGQARALVRSGQRLCPVSALTPVDAQDEATMARAAGQDGVQTLAPVPVQPQAAGHGQRRGFGGASRDCFDPRGLRSWSEDPQGMTVEVSPRRNNGRHRYRVELTGSCPVLSSSPTLTFRSGMGIGVICGNPGDAVTATLDRDPLDLRAPTRVASGASCGVGAVWPLD